MDRADCSAVLHAADNRQLTLERLERFDDRRQLETLALGGRRPLIHDCPEREIDESHMRLWLGRGLRHCGPRGNHSIQQRQSYGDASAAKKSTPGQVLLRNEHKCRLLSSNNQLLAVS